MGLDWQKKKSFLGLSASEQSRNGYSIALIPFFKLASRIIGVIGINAIEQRTLFKIAAPYVIGKTNERGELIGIQ